MKCEESQGLIEEYFDDELDQHTAGLVSNHLENCLLCSTNLQQLALDRECYSKYERGIDASPALWAKVRGRIAEKHSVQSASAWERRQISVSTLLALRFSVPVSAVLVLLAIVATVVVMKYINTKHPPDKIASSVERPSGEKQPLGATHPEDESNRSRRSEDSLKGTERERRNVAALRTAAVMAGKSSIVNRDLAETRTASELVRDAEKSYLKAIAVLTRQVERRPSQIDSETRAKLDGALASIDRTISATRKAVQKNPSDPLAVQYMLTAYAKKVDVLKEMTSY